MPNNPPSTTEIIEEMTKAKAQFHSLLTSATVADLAAQTNGTKWTNEQMLFHMLFGYMLVRRLRLLVKFFGIMPLWASKPLAMFFNSVAKPFHWVNYMSAVIGVRYFDHKRMGARMDKEIAALSQRISHESPTALSRGMHFPVTWDPFFRDFMSLQDIYHYATQHYSFHGRQLTIRQDSAL